MNGPQTIDEYLDELLFELRGREPGLVRRVMRETEDHLRESAEREGADGETRAIAAFGAPRTFAASFPKWRQTSARSMARAAVITAGIVLVTAGLNGAILLGLWQWRGEAFATREDSYTVRTPARECETVRFDTGSRLICQGYEVEALEADAMRTHLQKEVSQLIAVGALGLALLVAGVRIRTTARYRASGNGARLAGLSALAAFAVFFLYMGHAWGETAGKQGEGWFYAWGLAAALTFLVCSAWLAASSGKLFGVERLRRV